MAIIRRNNANEYVCAETVPSCVAKVLQIITEWKDDAAMVIMIKVAMTKVITITVTRKKTTTITSRKPLIIIKKIMIIIGIITTIDFSGG